MPALIDFQAGLANFDGAYAIDFIQGTTTSTPMEEAAATVTGGNLFLMNPTQRYVVIADVQAACRPDIFPFSKPVASITLEAVNSPTAIPCHVIPYQHNRAYAVQLPPGPGVAYAVTPVMDGCTLQISGDPANPLVSHTNVNATVGLANKGNAIAQGLIRLEQMFEQRQRTDHLGGANVQGPLPRHLSAAPDRFRSRVFATQTLANTARNQALLRGTEVDYFRSTHVSGNALANVRVHGRVRAGQTHYLTYTQFEYKPVRGQVGQLFHANNIVPQVVLGERRGGVWRFFHQQYTEIQFHVWEETRYRLTGGLSSRVQVAPPVPFNEFRVATILEHGEYWPNRVRHSENFQ